MMGLRRFEMEQQELTEYYFSEYLRPLIRKATKSDEYASLAGEDAIALKAFNSALSRAMTEVTELIIHEHDWNDNDYCNVCGTDGRA
jgi:hypothetical protein